MDFSLISNSNVLLGVKYIKNEFSGWFVKLKYLDIPEFK